MGIRIRPGTDVSRLPRRRHSPRKLKKFPRSNYADIEEYNARQHMRCVETRRRRTTGGGISDATTVARVENFRRVSPLEFAAYMAREQESQEHQNKLVDEIERVVLQVSTDEHWQYRLNSDYPQTRMLSSIVVEEWLHPRRFWKLRPDGEPPRPVKSSFAKIMRCDRSTWTAVWHKKFLEFQGYPQAWYEHGKYGLEN